MLIEKKPYVRLSPAAWAQVEAEWQSGEFTLAVLADKHGVTTRAIQLHIAKRGIVKGEAAKAIALDVKARVFAATLPDADAAADRALRIREATFRNAEIVEAMILERLEGAAADPTTTFAASAAIKMLANAAQALERLHALKKTALGLGDDDHLNADLPTLALIDLSAEEITELQGDDDDDVKMYDEIEDTEIVSLV